MVGLVHWGYDVSQVPYSDGQSVVIEPVEQSHKDMLQRSELKIYLTTRNLNLGLAKAPARGARTLWPHE
jgi:hypothetical protein